MFAVLSVLLWRRVQSMRRESEERRFRAILDSALDAVVTMDAAGRIVGWNGQAAAIFGHSAAAVQGRLLADTIIPPQYRDAHTRGLKRYLDTGQGPVLNRRIEITALHAAGHEFPVELTVSPITRPGEIQFSAFIRDITDRRRAESELRSRQAYLDELFEGAPEAIVILDGEDRAVRINGAFTRMFGYEVEELVGKPLGPLITPAELLQESEEIRRRVMGGEAVNIETLRRHKDGHQIEVSLLRFPVRVGAEQIATYGIYRDISARRKLEDQLVQAHKMESIGRLAGGVAHDFNNIVTAILSYLDSARTELAAGRSGDADLAEVERAGRRAAELTRQLLGFARRQIVEPRIVNLNDLTRDLRSLLSRLLGEDVHLELDLEPGLQTVRFDPSQFEQVLVNLAVNARDAMPDGGTLTVSTRNIGAGRDPGAPEDTKAEGCVVLTVRDTGHGMDAATLQRIFEPFFTTKPMGVGTGLGLATCHGIIEQSGGHCTVESEPGKGTIFRVYLPSEQKPSEPVPARPAAIGTLDGSETVLVVEDEESLRSIFRRILTARGYSVLIAASGEEAVRMAEQHQGEIHLLLTDVVLPGIGGREVAKAVERLRPGLKVLYMSGYTEDAIVRRGVLEHGIAFLPKPFSPNDVSRRVREVLDSAP